MYVSVCVYVCVCVNSVYFSFFCIFFLFLLFLYILFISPFSVYSVYFSFFCIFCLFLLFLYILFISPFSVYSVYFSFFCIFCLFLLFLYIPPFCYRLQTIGNRLSLMSYKNNFHRFIKHSSLMWCCFFWLQQSKDSDSYRNLYLKFFNAKNFKKI